jgi:hypothetical protein
MSLSLGSMFACFEMELAALRAWRRTIWPTDAEGFSTRGDAATKQGQGARF